MKQFTVTVLFSSLILASCAPRHSDRVQGYVEGEFVYVSSPKGGALQTLSVSRGAKVNAGDSLFSLDPSPERDALDQAKRRLAEARANLADAGKGKRQSELQLIESQIAQAQAALSYSAAELERQIKLGGIAGAGATQDLEKARATRDQDASRVAQLEADLRTARLGARDDLVAGMEANVRALEAARARSQWDLDQKTQAAPQSGIIFDTLYRVGEWVEPGRPVVALLPPQNIKVRAFVPEPIIAALHPGDAIIVNVDGAGPAITGKISFISPQAEYTPPVIYSQERRDKLTFMIEAVFDLKLAVQLHPGQPVDVQLRL